VSTNTPNLNIPKPNGNEFLNRTNFNQILDAIDTNVKAKLDEKETPAGSQAKANAAETNAKTYADQKVAALVNSSPTTLDTLKELADAMGDDPNFATTMTNLIGTKETPTGAQTKANTAENNAKTYSDNNLAAHTAEDATLTTKGHVQLSSSTSSTSETLAATPKAIKTVKDSIAPTIEQDSYKTVKSNKDSNGIYTTVQHKRKADGTLVRQSVLSGGTSPQYTTRTVTFYAADGTTVVKTDTFTLSYDADGVLISEV
jgi:hypothetical protein